MSQPKVPPELRSGDFMTSMTDETFRVPNEKLVYKKSFFAFLDILGYKALIEEKGIEAPRYIFNIVANAYQFHRDVYESVKVKILSDSILIWSECDHPIGFWNVMNVADMLRGSFLKKGLSIRGGLSFGDNFIHSDIIVSPALISAFKGEQIAVYPRIVIDEMALREGQRGIVQKGDGKKGMLAGQYFRVCEFDHIRKDQDGLFVVSPFFSKSGVYCLKHGLPGWYNQGDKPPTPEQISKTKESGIQALREMRESILKTHPKKTNPKVSEKYNYSVGEFNEFLKELGLEDEIKILDLITIPKNCS